MSLILGRGRIDSPVLTFPTTNRAEDYNLLQMPRKPIRYQQSGEFHFITFSRYRRRPYLETSTARELFERSLEAMRRRYGFFVTAYVVMPEHHPR